MKSQMQAVALISVFSCFLVHFSFAVVPSTIHYQGRLLDSSGDPVEGITDVTFAIYDTPSGGTPLWSEVHEDLDVHRGFVIVSLGSENPVYRTLIDKTFMSYYLGIQINEDPELVPRQEIETVPYALLSSGVVGDIQTDTAKLIIDGQPGFPPELIIKDHSSVTPTVDEYLRMTDLKVSLIVDRGAGDVDWSALEADRLTVWHPTGEIGSRLDKRSLQLTSPDITLPIPEIVIPPDPEPFFLIADDVFGQMFATMCEAGRLRAITESDGVTIGELLPSELSFSRNDGAVLGSRLGFTGLEVHGGSVQLLGGTDLTVTGTLDISGGTLDLSSSSLTVGGSLTVNGGGTFSAGSSLVLYGTGSQTVTLSGSGADIAYGDLEIAGSTTQSVYLSETGLKVRDVSLDHVDIGTGGSGAGGGYLDLSGGSGGGRVRLSAAGIGDLRADGSSLTLEPAGGGPGARLTVEPDELELTDDVPTATALLHRSGGLTLVLASGHTAYYRADGVQLTGPGASEYGATHRGFSLTRPSTNEALICSIDDPGSLLLADCDDDGLTDVAFGSDETSPFLRVSSGCQLRCDGTAVHNDMVIGGMVTVTGSCELEGPTVSLDNFEFDPNDDGLADVICESTPLGQTFIISPGTEMRCEGVAVCQQTLEVQGTMTCRSGWSCDANDDGTIDVQCSALTGPELLVATGTRFACDGLATFAQPTAVNSDLTVTGSLTVFGPKAFAQQHPEDPTKEIIYVALEGNEAGTYTRGSAQLKNGVAEILLPEDFHLVTNAEGLTAQITPCGPVNSMLYVESVTPTTLVVKSSNKKDANVKFDFMVNGVRSGFENHQVIRDKKSLAINE